MRFSNHEWLLRILAATICAAWVAGASAQRLEGVVVGVMDGDTIKVLDSKQRQHRVRLKGIDAPEHNQAWGNKAKQSLAGMVFRKRVQIEWDEVDRYGRIIGKVVADGRDINLVQLHRGMAWHYKHYAASQLYEDRVGYAEAEEAARKSGVGLWSDRMPTPPWEFRRR